jgi:hypothetical protein
MMNTEQRIRQVLHAEAEALPPPHPGEFKQQRRRLLVPSLAGVAALLIAAVASVAVLVSGDTATDSAAPTTRVESITTLPKIGIGLTGWTVLWAEESVIPIEDAASSDGVDYAVEESILVHIHSDRETTTAKIWMSGLTEGTVDETGWLGLNRADALVVNVRGHEARILDDGSDYVIAWRENPDTLVQVTVNTPGMEDVEADALVEAVAASLVDIALPVWNSYLELPHGFDRYPLTTTSLP